MQYRTVAIPTREEEIELARRIQAGDLEARNELVERNEPLAIDWARRFDLVCDEDAYQEARLGLMEAADRFDPDAGTKFSTYAVHWLRLKLVRWRWTRRQIIRIPAYQQYRSNTKNECRERYREDVERACGVVSYDAGDVDGWDIAATQPETDDVADYDAAELQAAMCRLRGRYRLVLAARYGLDGEERKSLYELAETLGVCKERVRQIQRKAEKELRGILTGEKKEVLSNRRVRFCRICGGEFVVERDRNNRTCTPECLRQLRRLNLVRQREAAKGRRA